MSEILFKPKLLYRKRVKNILENILKNPLFILTASIGYGKTSSVRRFLNLKRDTKQLWIPLGTNEIDEVAVWNKLCESVYKLNPLISKKLSDCGLPQNCISIKNIIEILKDEISLPTVLVIDDFDEIKLNYLGTLIEEVAYKNILNFHIVIISRSPIKFDYKHLLQRKLCYLMKQNDIAFSLEETNMFFELNGFKLSQEEINMLYKYTDGWISAVYIAILCYYQDHNFDNLRNRTHLVKTSIYDKLESNTKDAIMKLSVLDDFSLEQAIFVTNNKDAVNDIHKIAVNNCFVKFDNKNKIYIFHTLLKTVAFEKLEESNINITNLFNLCAEWYLQKGKINYALNYYHKAKNHKKILYTTQHYSNEIFNMDPNIILDIFNDIPYEEKLNFPLAFLIFIGFYTMNINFCNGSDMFYKFKEAYKINKLSENNNLILGEFIILEAFINFNDIVKVIKLFKEASLLLVTAHSKISYDEILFTLGIPNSLYLYHQKAGTLNTTVKILEDAVCHYAYVIKPDNVGYEYLVRAEYYYQTGDFTLAELFAHKARFKANAKKQLNIAVNASYTLINIAIFNAKIDDFKDCINGMLAIKNSNSSTLINDVDLAFAYIYSCMGKIEKIPQWIYTYDLSKCGSLVQDIGYISIIYGKTICLKKSFIELEILAENMLKDTSVNNYIFGDIMAYIFDAIAKYNLYGIEKSRLSLIKAINLAKKDNIIMPFVENAVDILPILRKVKNEYVSYLLPMCEKFKLGIDKINASQSIGNLTEREREILNLVANGYKNIEIGEFLGIASVTVEKILSNTYKKLGVKNRVAAVTKIRIM